jgi:hypothetical protein
MFIGGLLPEWLFTDPSRRGAPLSFVNQIHAGIGHFGTVPGFHYPAGPEIDLNQPTYRLRCLKHADPVVRHLAWERLKDFPTDERILNAAVMPTFRY